MNFDVPPYATAVLEVDLSAVAHNYLTIQKALPNHCRIGAVVKCNAYGVGAPQVVKTLTAVGCRKFFVACAQEALEINHLVSKDQGRIFILNGIFEGSEDLYVDNNWVPILISLKQLHLWVAHGKKIGRPLPAVIHVDTGLGREGLDPLEMQVLMENAGDLKPYLDLQFIMSHLGNSNDTEDPKNPQQLEAFKEALRDLRKAFEDESIPASLVNSSGISLGPDYFFDIVRPAAALYGYKSAWGEYLPLELPLKAYGRILRTRWVEEGDTLSYQGTYRCHRKTHLALVALGHGDGLLRGASNRGALKINGLRAPILGRVSMDLVIVDITDHPDGNAVADGWATLYDDMESMKDFAEAAQTSAYEVMVRQGQRYYRIYKE